MTSPAPTTTNTGRRMRRPRTARACDACRVKKNRCDDDYPCAYCRRHGLECVTMGQVVGARHADASYVKDLEEQIKQLRRQQDWPVPQDSTNTTEAYSPRARPGLLQGARARIPPEANSSDPSGAGQQELSAVNAHTRNVEFYGSSSAVALLSHVERAGASGRKSGDGKPGGDTESGASSDNEPAATATATSIVSNLHNPAFSPASEEQGNSRKPLGHSASATNSGGDSNGDRKNALPAREHPQCRTFILNFFASIHYIHPILDKADFLRRCDERMEQIKANNAATSFDALYYAILSLGALVGPREDEPPNGVSNLQWSRLFFEEAVRRRHELDMVTDLDMVQCYFILAKVCQNELNPHLAYMYIGLAVRTALAMGINREPRNRASKNVDQLKAEARTWWGLYSLEVEMSFSMGRPDTLGADGYHNRHFPVLETGQFGSKSTPNSTDNKCDELEPPHCAIIKIMVDLSRIIKNISLDIYLSDRATLRTLHQAFGLQSELDRWADSVPQTIRPRPKPADLVSLRSARDSQWVKRQRLVLTLRYLNLRILIFGSLLLHSSSTQAELEESPIMKSQDAQRAIEMCIEAARNTIEIIFMMYQHHDFFRTWFYNTTYVSFAASMLLVYITKKLATQADASIGELFEVVGRAIEVLETMDECIVALKSAKLLRRAMERARRRHSQRIRGEGDVSTAQQAATISGSQAPSAMYTSTAADLRGIGYNDRPGHQYSHDETQDRGHDTQDGYGPNGVMQEGFDGGQYTTTTATDTIMSEPDLFLSHYWGPLNFFDADSMAVTDFTIQFDELDGSGGSVHFQ